MNRFFALIVLTFLALFCATAVPALGPGAEMARQQLIEQLDVLEQFNAELDYPVDSNRFDMLRDAVGTLEEAELRRIADRGLGESPEGPVPDAITFPDPEILPICEAASPTEGYVLFAIATVLNEIMAVAYWVCLQSAVGENTATACAVTNGIRAAANMAFLEASICLNAQRTGYSAAEFETQGNIADHLNQYIDATISSRASQSSLNDLQTGINQELNDLTALANSLGSDVSDLSADLTDISNSTAALISATVNMTSVSQDLQLKTLITQAEAEEIDDFAADTQERLEIVRTRTQQISASIASLQQLLDQLGNTADSRIERELDASVAQALADPDFNIVRYKLPAAMNGELERSREVLVRAIMAFNSIGADTSKSTQFLTMGDDQFNAGRYLTAYDHFSTAYQMLLGQSSGSPGRGE